MRILAIVLFLISFGVSAKNLKMDEAIKMALDTHPAVGAAKANLDAEKSSIAPQYFPENPSVGIMKENGMRSWVVSQDFSFPTKYFQKGAVQRHTAHASQEALKGKQLEIREQVVGSFYNVFLQKKTLELLGAQKDLLREIARTAESRRMTGAVSAQDEMKAHLEQAKIENDLINARQDLETNEARLKSLLGFNDEMEISDLEKPRLNLGDMNMRDVSTAKSPTLNEMAFKVDASEAQKGLAMSSFLPDFSVSFQKSMEAGSNDKTVSFELKFPIWFLEKERSEYSAVASRVIEARQNLEANRRDVEYEKRALSSRITAKDQTLRLYETTLIPQSMSTLNSSRAAYRSGRATFLDLLDSERTVYSVQIAYYQELKEFAESIANLERILGKSISTLPFEEMP